MGDASSPLRIEDAINETCPWSGRPIAADGLTIFHGAVVGFCDPGCRDKFDTAVNHFEAARQAKARLEGPREQESRG